MTTTPTTTPISPDWLADLVACSRSGLIWQDPPEIWTGPQPRWSITRRWSVGDGQVPDERAGRAIAAMLRARPGRWAVIFTGQPETAARVQRAVRGGRGGFRYVGCFESVTRTVSGQIDLYVRFCGVREETPPVPVPAEVDGITLHL